MTLSLQLRLQLLVAGTVVALGAVMLVGLDILSTKQIERALRRDARASSGLLDQLVAERRSALTDQCVLLARQPVLRAVIGTGDVATTSDSVKDFLTQLNASGAIVTDSQGAYLGCAGTETREGSRIFDQGINESVHGRIWSGVVAERSGIVQAVTVPVFSGPMVVGTFTAVRPVDSGLAAQLSSALGAGVAFVAHASVVGASLALPPAMRISDRSLSAVSIEGRKYAALAVPLSGAASGENLRVIILRPYDRELAFYAPFKDGFILVLAITLFLATVGGGLMARSMTRSLGAVVESARVLQTGAWPSEFDAPGSDEIGLLQRVFNDMTRTLRANQERLEALIDTDPLTSLDNHRRFRENIAHETRRSASSGTPLCVLLIDLDRFQAFNQKRGHAAGDEALVRIASLLRSSAPDVATAARYGGQQFALILPELEITAAEQAAETMREAIRDAFDAEITASVGAAQFGLHSSQADGLVLAAELALSRAKQLGRDRVCRFDTVPGADTAADPSQLQRFLKDGSIATIQALAAAVDAKDPYTRGHSANVARYASDLAMAVGGDTEFVELVHITGTLHDVGKIGVPDSILKKPDRLTVEERAVMETHPVLGEVIVKKAPQLANTLAGVRHHHERWDGAGYPDRLAGEAIPLIARILAVADTFDAMTSDRPYRKGLPVDVALREIRSGAGTQFDPALALAFVAMMDAERQTPAKAA